MDKEVIISQLDDTFIKVTVWSDGRYIDYKTITYNQIKKYKFTKRYPYPTFQYRLFDYRFNKPIIDSEYIFKCLKKLER